MTTRTPEKRERTKQNASDSPRSSPAPDRTSSHRYTNPREDEKLSEPSGRLSTKNGRSDRQPNTPPEDDSHRPARTEAESKKAEKQAKRKAVDWAAWLDHFSAAKILSLSTLVVAIGLFIPFAADLATGWPFHRASLLMDAAFAGCAAVLALLTLHTMREID